MRRGIALLMVLLLISGASYGETYSLRWTIGQGENAEEGTALLARQEAGWVLTSSWLEEYAVVLDFIPEDSGLTGAESGPLPAGEEVQQAAEALARAWQAWADSHAGEKRSGVFSGDAFETAKEEQAWELSWSDAAVILRQAQKEDPGAGSWMDDLIRAAEDRAMNSHSSLKCRSYDGGSKFSLTLEGNDSVLGTLSGNLEETGKAFLVAGWAENGKDYYAEIRLAATEQGLSWETRLLADDTCAGYRALTGKDAAVLTWNGQLDSGINGLSIRTELVPDNGTGPFFLDADAGKDEVRIAMMAGSRDQQLAVLSAGRRSGMASGGSRSQKLIYPDRMSAEESSRLSGLLTGRITRVMMRLMEILPPQMLNVLLQ